MYPDERPFHRISDKERVHIETAVRKAGSSRTRPPKVPWRDLFSCVPVWAIIAADMGSVFGLSVYSNQLPSYMKNVLGFSIKEVRKECMFMCLWKGMCVFVMEWYRGRSARCV